MGAWFGHQAKFDRHQSQTALCSETQHLKVIQGHRKWRDPIKNMASS